MVEEHVKQHQRHMGYLFMDKLAMVKQLINEGYRSILKKPWCYIMTAVTGTEE